VIGVEWTLWRIHRDVIEVDAEAISLGVSIREQAALEHLEAFLFAGMGLRQHTHYSVLEWPHEERFSSQELSLFRLA
jgi:hypothetical protein